MTFKKLRNGAVEDNLSDKMQQANGTINLVASNTNQLTAFYIFENDA